MAGLTGEASEHLDEFMAALADRLADEPVAHADETGTRVGGVKAWFHVLSTAVLTLLAVHPRRGVKATADMGVLARFRGVLVHERWAPYWTATDADHALCGAHLLRDLAAVAELSGQADWAHDMADLLLLA